MMKLKGILLLLFIFFNAVSYGQNDRLITSGSAVDDEIIEEDYINVKNYGAIGDGTTSDVAAVLSAISAAEASNVRIIHFPPGDYNLEGLTRGQQRSVIFHGEGNVVNAGYSVDIHDDNNRNTVSYGAITQKQIQGFLNAVEGGSAKVVFAGTSLAGENQGNGAQDSYPHLVAKKLDETYDSDIDYVYRLIGGEQIFDFAGITQPNSFPDWYTDTNRPWYEYVEDEEQIYW